MSIESYTHYANIWTSTKPIRGRAGDIRPIGNRRRDWETIVRKQLLSGEYSYAAKLHNTECVEYFPNGDVTLRTGGWDTPSTADFIHEHSPFMCAKRNGKLWVKKPNVDTMLPIIGELQMRWTTTGHEPIGEVVIKKRVVNRVQAKAAREPIVPFLNWLRAFLTMSEGWVMHETMKQVLGWVADAERPSYGERLTYSEKDLYFMIKEAHEMPHREDMHLKVLCYMVGSRFVYAIDTRRAETVTWNSKWPIPFEDKQYSYDAIKDKLYAMVVKHEQVTEIKEVKPGARAMSNVV